MKKKLTHEDIPAFEHDILKFDGDLWIRLRCATAESKAECECEQKEYDLENVELETS